jgi:hypothetical protein
VSSNTDANGKVMMLRRMSLHVLPVTAVLCGCLVASLCEAAYKCQTAKGVVYQDKPCGDGNQSQIDIRTDDQRQREHNRLQSQREEKAEREAEVKKSQKHHAEIGAGLTACVGSPRPCPTYVLTNLVQRADSSDLLRILGDPKTIQHGGDRTYYYWNVPVLSETGKPKIARFQVVVGGCDNAFRRKTDLGRPSGDVCAVNVTE